jgi:hypothetical protein
MVLILVFRLVLSWDDLSEYNMTNCPSSFDAYNKSSVFNRLILSFKNDRSGSGCLPFKNDRSGSGCKFSNDAEFLLQEVIPDRKEDAALLINWVT